MRKTQERDKCSSIGIDHKLPCAGKLELWSRQRQPRMMAPLRMKVTGRPARCEDYAAIFANNFGDADDRCLI
jgi:hypothetical protein